MYASGAPTVLVLRCSKSFLLGSDQEVSDPFVCRSEKVMRVRGAPVASLFAAFFLWWPLLQMVEIVNSPKLTHLPQDPVAPMKHIPRWARHIESLGIG